MIAMAQQKDRLAPFALSVLTEVPTAVSLPASIAIADAFESDAPESEQAFMAQYAYALALISMPLKAERADPEICQKIIPILKHLIASADKYDNETLKSSAVVAFRGFGSLDDIDYLKAISFRQTPYAGTEKLIIKHLKKKFKSQF